MSSPGPLWGLYDPPTVDVLVADLQALRQAPVSPAMVRSRYGLFHLPFLVGVQDMSYRATLLTEAVRLVLDHPRLTDEQRIIARWIFFPPDEASQLFLHQRRERARQEIGTALVDRDDRPLERTVKQIEDREARLLPLIAHLLLDPGFGAAFLDGHGLVQPVQPPVDPYEGKGYEWAESDHTLEFDGSDPRLQRLRYEIVVRAVRREQRLFWIRHDPLQDGEELPVTVLSTDEGHALLGRFPDVRPNQARAHVLIFSLGGVLALGETTTLAFERSFRQQTPNQPWFGMEMDDTPQARLVLRVVLPPVMRCTSWACENWTPGTSHALLAGRTEHRADPDRETVAVYDIHDPEPRHHYQITWSTDA